MTSTEESAIAVEALPDAHHPAGVGLIKPSYDPNLTNEDLAPLHKQNWRSYNIFAFWMSDVHSVGGYVTLGGLFALGITAWQVLISLIIGIVIVMVFANLVAKPSQKTGVPYPVINRAIFGVKGANIPAIIRGPDRGRLVRRADLPRRGEPEHRLPEVHPGLGGAARADLPRPERARLDLVRDPLGRPGGAVLARHGDHPPVHRLRRPRRLRRDGRARDLPRREGGRHRRDRPEPALGSRPQPRRLDPGHDRRDRADRVATSRDRC